jgi:hypothetical protein
MTKHLIFASDYLNKLSRKFLGEKTKQSLAHTVIEIHPGNIQYHPKALYIESELQRITGVGLSGTIPGELRQIQEHTQAHSATMAYQLKDLILVNGNLYAHCFKHGFNTNSKILLASGFVEVIEQETVLAQTWLGTKFFGHFLSDDVPLNRLANQLGIASGIPRSITKQQEEYSEIFNIRTQLLPDKAWLKSITVIDDYHFNEHKQARWKDMCDEIIRLANNPLHTGVFLMRGDTGDSRILLNEQKVAAHLQAMGFTCINPGKMAAQEVIRAVANAKIVVGVEGSHLMHGFLGVAHSGTLLVLQPPMRFSCVYKERCDIMNIKFAFHVCEAFENGFVADINAIDILLNKIALSN